MRSTGTWRAVAEKALLAVAIIALVVGGVAVMKVSGVGAPEALAGPVLPGAPVVAGVGVAPEIAAGPVVEGAAGGAARGSAESAAGSGVAGSADASAPPADVSSDAGATQQDSGAAVAEPAPGTQSEATREAARSGSAAGVSGAAARIDSGWLAEVSVATGIPARPLAAYAWASIVVAKEQPSCGLAWNTLAGIGRNESNHGRFGGGSIADDGRATSAIRGPALNGNGYAAIADTDNGAWDGDAVWDRAVGPLQFIPSTWAKWGTDASGDGVADPQQIDDAAVAAARYLCASGPMTTPQGWRAAIFSYNRVTQYVDDVAAVATSYALAVRE